MTRLLNIFKPYRVHVLGSTATYTHRAWTFAEALAWAECYPRDWGRAVILTRTGRWVGERI